MDEQGIKSLESAYRTRLKECGFRSWKKANQRRYELINRDIAGEILKEEATELHRLQELCDAYVEWKVQVRMNRG